MTRAMRPAQMKPTKFNSTVRAEERSAVASGTIVESLPTRRSEECDACTPRLAVTYMHADFIEAFRIRDALPRGACAKCTMAFPRS